MNKREYNKQLKEYIADCVKGKYGQGSAMLYNIKHSKFNFDDVYKEIKKHKSK